MSWFAGIVDDDDAVRDSLRFLLESNDIPAQAFDSAASFLAADTSDMGCLVLDLHMPGMTGLELLILLRSRGMERPVIVVSGRRDPAQDSLVRAAGATHILSKPFEDERLLGLVREALAQAA